MIRRLHCEACGRGGFFPTNAEDAAAGWRTRFVWLAGRKPASHGVDVSDGRTTQHTELPSLVCDGCGQPIPDGQRCLAITMYQGINPPTWEAEFGIPE